MRKSVLKAIMTLDRRYRESPLREDLQSCNDDVLLSVLLRVAETQSNKHKTLCADYQRLFDKYTALKRNGIDDF